MLVEGWVLTSATAINDYGDIVGTGTKLVDGVAQAHGFLLTNGTISGPPPVENQAPVAVASADVTSVKVRTTVIFFSIGSTDPDGTITSYSWDFMDGKFSTEANPSHKFNKAGTYPVTLTVTDNQGQTASGYITITVTKKR